MAMIVNLRVFGRAKGKEKGKKAPIGREGERERVPSVLPSTNACVSVFLVVASNEKIRHGTGW